MTATNTETQTNADYTALLEKALAIARAAHAGQVDKAGRPYIEHPIAVMEQLDTPTGKIVALLHDAVEDSELTLEHLKAEGFPDELIEAIDAITKQPGESYDEYLERVMSNAIALKVKIADVTHNLDLTRIENPTSEDFERVERYMVTLKRLRAALEWQEGRTAY